MRGGGGGLAFVPFPGFSPAASGVTNRGYSLFILVMRIRFQRISNPHDFMKHVGGKMSL